MNVLSWLGIGSAYAANAVPPAQGTEGSLMSVLPMLIIFILIFYFLLIRPQSKRQKEQRQLLANIAQGDEVMTSGGILGKVTQLEDTTVRLLIAEGVEVSLQKSSIVNVLPKGTLKAFTKE